MSKKSKDNDIFFESIKSRKMVLNKIYAYGCYSKKDIKNFRKSMNCDDSLFRMYDYILKMIKDVFKLNIEAERRKKELCYRFTQDNYDKPYSSLYEVYKLKSYTNEKLKSFFLIQQVLNKEYLKKRQIVRKGLTRNEIIDFLEEEINNVEREKEYFFNESTIYYHLEDLYEIGILEKKTIKKNYVYSIKDNFFDKFDIKELEKLFCIVEFARGIVVPAVDGYFFSEKISNYFIDKFSTDDIVKNRNIFSFKGQTNHQLLDEEDVYTILEAINCGKRVSFKNKKKKVLEERPIEIQYDKLLGRWYLITEKGINRLEMIENLKACDEDDKKEKYVKNKKQKKIVLEVYSEFTAQKILRERGNGKLSKIEENLYEYEFFAEDVLEHLPWIRSLGDGVKVKKSDEHKLSEKLCSEWEEMLNVYKNI